MKPHIYLAMSVKRGYLSITSACLFSLCVFILWACTVFADPIPPMNGGPGSVRWPKDTTVDVYIAKDPDGKGREDLIKDGIQRWVDPLKDKGVTVSIHLGKVPEGTTKNYVFVQWAEPGSLKGDANPDEVGNGTPVDSNGKIVAGRIDIDRGVSGDTFIKNLGAHEFGHACGFADDSSKSTDSKGQPATNVMNPKVPTDKETSFTKKDSKELDTMYADAAGNFPQGTITATVTSLAGGLYHYDYRAMWTGGPDIPLVEFGTNGLSVFNVASGGILPTGTNGYATTPDGWLTLLFGTTAGIPCAAIALLDGAFADCRPIDLIRKEWKLPIYSWIPMAMSGTAVAGPWAAVCHSTQWPLPNPMPDRVPAICHRCLVFPFRTGIRGD